MKITKLILMRKIQLEENASGAKTIYIEGLSKRIEMDTTDMEYKILSVLKHLIGFTEANELVKGNFICYHYSDRNIILKPTKRKEISLYYSLDYDPYNMYIVDNQENTQKIKMTRDYRKIMTDIMEKIGKRLKIKEVI